MSNQEYFFLPKNFTELVSSMMGEENLINKEKVEIFLQKLSSFYTFQPSSLKEAIEKLKELGIEKYDLYEKITAVEIPPENGLRSK